jgi:hypothetical protein
MFDTVDSGVRATGRAAVQKWPAVRKPLLVGRDVWARAYVGARTVYNNYRFDAPIEPYRILRVDPAAIDRYPGSFPKPKYRYAGAVVDGDWDQATVRFTDLDVYRAYEQHFVEGVPWHDTAFYDRVVSEIDAGNQQWGCTSRDAFDRRCEQLDELYEQIRTHGFLSQDELRASSLDDPFRTRIRPKTERFKDELSIHIGRDGDLLFNDGRNRLAIAKILDLDTVPVRVLMRHRDWQRTRDDYVRGRVVDPALDTHPDLQYLTPGSLRSTRRRSE